MTEPLTEADVPVLAAAVVEKVERDLSRVTLGPGTVVSTGASDAIVQAPLVHVDGDLPVEHAIPVGTLIGDLAVGQRVMLVWAPPHGVFAVGSMTGGGGGVLRLINNEPEFTCT